MTRIVLSPVEPGMRRIYHGRKLIGHALTEWDARDTWNGSWRRRSRLLMRASGAVSQLDRTAVTSGKVRT